MHDGRSEKDSSDDLKEQGERERLHAAVGRPVERRRPRECHEQHSAAEDPWVGCTGEAHVCAAKQAELLPVRRLPHPERYLHAVEDPHRRHPPQSDEVRHIDDDVVCALLMEQTAAAHVLSALARVVRAAARVATAERRGENGDPPQQKVAGGHAVLPCPASLLLAADADRDQQDEPVPAKQKAEAGPRHVHRGELQGVGKEGVHGSRRASQAPPRSLWVPSKVVWGVRKRRRLRPHGHTSREGRVGREYAANVAGPRAAGCSHLQNGLGVGQQLEGGRALGDLELGLVHVGGDLGEERRRQVALARVGEHGQDDRALGRRLGGLERGPHGAAARDAREQALLGGECLGGGDGARGGDGHQHVP
eukprot:scaffold80015_cov60-Phaeocystis_antarctica.AAC.5